MNTLKGKFRAIIFAAIIMLTVAQPVMAQGLVPCGLRSQDPVEPNGTPQVQQGQCTWSDFFELGYRLTNYLIGMAGFVAIAFIVWGGLQMLLSAGNPAKIQDAKSTIRNAILGLILTLTAYLIIGYAVGLLLPGAGTGNPVERIIQYLR